MSNTKFTPGPWKFQTSRDWIYINQHGNIAKVPNSDWSIENNIRDEIAFANAKLIAAAPELLEALESALPYLHKETRIKAELAIRKATE